jgi:RNA polymerase sigma-70 factor (ECF subfamily)
MSHIEGPRSQLEQDIVFLLPALRRLAHKYERSTADAEDLAQDAVLKALNHLDRFEAGTNLQAWLFTILRNTYFTKRSRARRFPLGSIGDAAEYDVAVTENQEWILYANDVRAALLSIPEERRKALVMVASGETYDTVARQSRCEIGTVKSRVWRARSELAAAMGEPVPGAAQLH